MAKKQNRDKSLRLYYTREEYEQLKVLAAKSLHRTISSYVRRTSLEKPVVIMMRNASFDRLIDEMILQRKELAAIRQGVVFTPEQQERMVVIQDAVRILINKIAESCMQR